MIHDTKAYLADFQARMDVMRIDGKTFSDMDWHPTAYDPENLGFVISGDRLRFSYEEGEQLTCSRLTCPAINTNTDFVSPRTPDGYAVKDLSIIQHKRGAFALLLWSHNYQRVSVRDELELTLDYSGELQTHRFIKFDCEPLFMTYHSSEMEENGVSAALAPTLKIYNEDREIVEIKHYGVRKLDSIDTALFHKPVNRFGSNVPHLIL